MIDFDWSSVSQWAPTAVLGIVGWLLKNSVGRFSDQIARVQTDHEALRNRVENEHDEIIRQVDMRTAELAAGQEILTKQLRSVAQNKADREDFVREAARSRLAMEKLVESVARLEGKLDSGVHIATGINRLAEAMEKKERDGQNT